MTTELPRTTGLQPGQALRMAVDRGFTLMVMQGCVNVSAPPSWFGETMFTVAARLDEGEVFVSERGGWIEVAAMSASRVLAVPACSDTVPAGASRIGRLFQRLMGAA